jgi:superfamily II DNA or RNA helicase
MPLSWRGTLQQYVGRLHRIHHGKKVVGVFDYVDAQVPMLGRIYEKRLKGYRAIGYEMESEDHVVECRYCKPRRLNFPRRSICNSHIISADWTVHCTGGRCAGASGTACLTSKES